MKKLIIIPALLLATIIQLNGASRRVLSLTCPQISQEQSELNSKLRNAARSGDVNAIKQYLQDGADANAYFERDFPHAGVTVLTEAINSGSADAVRTLLEQGAIVETFAAVPDNKLEPKSRNMPQLSYAIMVKAPIEIINLLIQYSKDLNITDMSRLGWTPYKVALKYQRDDVMKQLELAGADTNTTMPVSSRSKIRRFQQ